MTPFFPLCLFPHPDLKLALQNTTDNQKEVKNKVIKFVCFYFREAS